jgi:hypothetical protein
VRLSSSPNTPTTVHGSTGLCRSSRRLACSQPPWLVRILGSYAGSYRILSRQVKPPLTISGGSHRAPRFLAHPRFKARRCWCRLHGEPGLRGTNGAWFRKPSSVSGNIVLAARSRELESSSFPCRFKTRPCPTDIRPLRCQCFSGHQTQLIDDRKFMADTSFDTAGEFEETTMSGCSNQTEWAPVPHVGWEE